MNINNRLLKSGFERSPNLIWDPEESRYVQDSSKNNWKWTYVYKINPKFEIRAIVSKKSLSIFTLDYKSLSKWGKKPLERCIFSCVNIYNIKSFGEILNTLPPDVRRDIKLKCILRR
jgi:hypothetical protein